MEAYADKHMACEAREGVHWVRIEKEDHGWTISTSKRCKKLLRLGEEAARMLRHAQPWEINRNAFKRLVQQREREKWEARINLIIRVLHACKKEYKHEEKE